MTGRRFEPCFQSVQGSPGNPAGRSVIGKLLTRIYFERALRPAPGARRATDHQDQEEYEEQIDADARQDPLAQARLERDCQ
jgi:hypothetical protein